jgi:DNA polymerase III subunit epsilon
MKRFKNNTETPVMNWHARFSLLAKQAGDHRINTFYRNAVIPDDTPAKQVSFLSLDLETTGLNPLTDDIVSIGFIPLRHDRILCSGARYWVVRPEKERPDIQTVIHGITHTDITACPRLDDVLAPLLEAMAGRVVVAHYSRIELGFLGKAVSDVTGDVLEFPVVDTMELESRKHPVVRPNVLQRWMGEKPSPSLRLAHARQRYNLPPYRPHHALTDALAAAELFLAQMADQFTPDTPVSELLYHPS